MPSNHLIFCHPLFLPPSIFPSIRVFSCESVLRISPSNEYSGLISCRMDWLDLLAVQGTLKSLLQNHSSKASIFQCSAFFIVQLSHPYMTTLTSSVQFSSVQFISVAQLCPTFCNLMNRSTPGLPVHHQLLEFTQTHVHRVREAIQPSHPLSSPSPPAPNPLSIRVFSNDSVLHIKWPKHWNLGFSISPSKNTTVQKHQFFSAQLSSQSNSHIHT